MVNVRTSLIELTHTSYLPVSCCADHCDHVCVVEYPHNTPLTHGHWPRLQVNFYFHPRHSTSPEQKSCSLSCTASLSHLWRWSIPSITTFLCRWLRRSKRWRMTVLSFSLVLTKSCGKIYFETYSLVLFNEQVNLTNTNDSYDQDMTLN